MPEENKPDSTQKVSFETTIKLKQIVVDRQARGEPTNIKKLIDEAVSLL